MKGILLAGGLGTRLYPVTRVINKHLLPVYNQPMIFWGLKTLIESGIKEIIIVTGPPFENQVKKVVANFNDKKVKLSWVRQPKPMGMPEAIQRCRKLVGNDEIMVVAGDNIFGRDYKKEVDNFKSGSVSFLHKVNDPERFGVPVYDKNNKIIKIEEKPKRPKTSWVVTGPHLFDNKVFGLIEKLTLSKRGELEISELNNLYLEKSIGHK